ncbi:50S ribosomal protein L19e [Candidatus Woesearchaeota archaeon]|nr:50S ribosomal protein L19e [Candidatus Woesearchaeota archaeon]|tara:strand:- start:748 stop:1206 length:459 start_codon:yes stop_codon:yes gene_type:complete
MKLSLQKRLAGAIKKASKKRVKFDSEQLEDVKEAITKSDLRGLLKDGSVRVEQKKGVSRVRARKRAVQRAKGLQKGPGKRKGSANARASEKLRWMNRVRSQRTFLKELRTKKIINTNDYRMLYLKSKGGFFRSKAHIKIYIDEHGLTKNGKK